MSKRFAWLFASGVLILIGFLVACGSVYNSASDGLVIVGSQGSGLLETFSFSLTSGHNAAVSNTPNDTADEVCVLGGLPSSIVIDPAGAYAYSILNGENTVCNNSNLGIQAFKVNSDGTIATSGSLITLSSESVGVCQPNNTLLQETVPVAPLGLAMDSAGKYLFVADSMTTDSSGNAVPGAISVFAIGSGGTLTEVASSPFTVPPSCNATTNFSAVALSPTVFPGLGIQGNSSPVCTVNGEPVPTNEYLYATDKSNNNLVWEFAVNSSTGALTAPPGHSAPISFAAGTTPSGVAVDPCDRFVYISDLQTNQISAYTICNGTSTQSSSNCPQTPSVPDWSLVAVTGSPFSLTAGNGPGPILVDPFGNYVYALDTLSSQISILKIAQVSGGLTSTGTASTGSFPISMTIRGDDNWLFVTNSEAATLSEYSITPDSGALTPSTAIDTDNLPWGVAVK